MNLCIYKQAIKINKVRTNQRQRWAEPSWGACFFFWFTCNFLLVCVFLVTSRLPVTSDPPLCFRLSVLSVWQGLRLLGDPPHCGSTKPSSDFEKKTVALRCFFLSVFQSRALNGICEKTVQTSANPLKSEMACLEEVHITNVKPGEGLVSSDTQTQGRDTGLDHLHSDRLWDVTVT